MQPFDPRDDRDQEVEGRLLPLAERALGLRLEEIVASGYQTNTAGVRSEHLLFSERLDSRTYFVQDMGYGQFRGAGVFEGSDDELLDRARLILERLDVPLDEIAEASVLQESISSAEVRDGRLIRMGDIQPGPRTARITRQIDGVPVWTSNLLLGLTREAEVGFMQLHWPEVSGRSVQEARRLQSYLERGWQPPDRPGAAFESAEAGVVHSPAIAFVMDVSAAIRVVYTSTERAGGKKPLLYLDGMGEMVPMPRVFDRHPDWAAPPHVPGRAGPEGAYD